MNSSANTALVPVGLEPRSLQEAESLATKLSQSALMPSSLRGKPADVLVVMLTGHELGVSPLTALRSIHVVQGRPVLDAALIVAMAKKSGACDYFQLVESTAERAVYETRRKGEQPTRMEFTIEDAKRAGLTGKDNWKNYPAAMLRARCSAALARAVYPDLVLNVMTEDEAEEIASREPTVVHHEPSARATPTTPEPTDAELVQEGPSQEEIDAQAIAFWTKQFAAAPTLADLDAVSAELRRTKPNKTVRDELVRLYGERKAQLAGGDAA